MNKFLFYIKQLLPLTYYTKYRVQTGEQYLDIWTQWLCKPLNIKHFRIAD